MDRILARDGVLITTVLAAFATFASCGVHIGFATFFASLFIVGAGMAVACSLTQRSSRLGVRVNRCAALAISVLRPQAPVQNFWRRKRLAAWCGTPLVLAVALGFSANWLGIAWNAERFTDSPSYVAAIARAQEARKRLVSWLAREWAREAERTAPNLSRSSVSHAVRARPVIDRRSWLEEHGASDQFYQTHVVAGFPMQRIEGHGGGRGPKRLPLQKGLWALEMNFVLWTATFLVLAIALPRRVVRRIAVASIPVAVCASWFGLGQLASMLQ